MRCFKIEKPDESLRDAIKDKIDNLNKPKGSLGLLETLAEQICLIQQTLTLPFSIPVICSSVATTALSGKESA